MALVVAMAEDEQPFERLHMDNDYEGGEWIGGEFFFKSKVHCAGRPPPGGAALAASRGG